MKEEKLIRLLAKGDTDALDEIIKSYTAYVRTVAYNFSRNMLTNEDIDEVAADIFYKLWKAREKLDADIGLRPLLSAMTRNAVKDRFRRNPPPAEDIDELEISSDFLVEDAAALNELMACLYEGLERLSDEEQEIFYRFYFNGEKASQIAAAKGVERAAVAMKLSRTRNKLKSYLNERGYDHV